jgi:hypothetical protein
VPVAYPVVPMVQALTKHIKHLVVLPDELCKTCIRKFRTLCESCCCNNEHKLRLASHWHHDLAEEGRLLVCPLARLFLAC